MALTCLLHQESPRQSYFLLQSYVARRGADRDVELSRLKQPAASRRVVEEEGARGQSDCEPLLLAGLQEDLTKTFQLLRRTRQTRLQIAHVDLRDLRAIARACVLDLELDRHERGVVAAPLRQLQAGVFKARVR